MALVVLDASVVIALLNEGDANHKAAVAALTALSTEELVISASTFAEILVGPYRAGSRAERIVEGFVTDRLRVEPVSVEIARRSARLRAGTQALRLADALVIATGDVLDAAVLTADRGWSKVSKSVRVI